MPLITFETAPLSEEIKAELIIKLTNLSSEITGIPKESFMLLIRELPDQNIGVGGITVKEIKEKLGRK